MQIKIPKISRRLWLLALVFVLFVPLMTSATTILLPKPALAAVNSTSDNILLIVGQKCHDIPKDKLGSQTVYGGDDCKYLQDNFVSKLGCVGDGMFYTHDFHPNPQDQSYTVTKWYTKEGVYKACYNAAQDAVNTLNSDKCKVTVDGSDNNKACVKLQDQLSLALGCDKTMFFKDKDFSKNHLWHVENTGPNNSVADCQNRVNKVGNLRLVIIDGNGNAKPDIHQIKDAAVLPETPSTAGGNSGSSSAPKIDCPILSFNPLNWLICPAAKGMVAIASGLDDAISSQLSVGSPGNSDDPNQIFCDNAKDNNPNNSSPSKSCSAYYNAWFVMRNIALGLMVIAGLAAIIAELLGTELFDAYTIRKILPRVLIAAITITLSWQLMQFFVTLTNDLGYGVRQLIYLPFQSFHSATLGGGSTVVAGILGGVASLSLGVFGWLTLAATAALAVFVAFLVLIIRQLLIIVLIIFAPVAIVAYILPNTQNLYRLWWDSFAKALLMFPIIAAFIAAGRVFAVVAGTNNDNVLGQLLGFAAYFAPYFLIPATFKFAGGALRQIGGFVNDRHRGAFDRLRQARNQQISTNWKAMGEGNRFRGDSAPFVRFNKMTKGLAHIPDAGMTPWKMKSRFQAGMAESKISSMGEYMEKSAAWKAMSGNDDYLQATMKNMGGGDTEADWRHYLSAQGYEGRSLEQGVAMIRAAKRDTNNEVFKAAAVVANASTGTGWKEGGAGQMMESINEAAGGDRDLAARMLAETRQRATQARRIDLGGAGFGGQIRDLEAMNDGKMTAEQATERNNRKVLELNGAGAIASSRGDSVKLLAPAMQDEIRAAHASGNDVTIKRAWAKAANMYDTMSYAAPENAELFADQVFAQPFDGTMTQVARRNARGENVVDANGQQVYDAVPLTGRMVMDRFRGDSEFLNIRRELGMSEQQQQQIQRGIGQDGGAGMTGMGGTMQ